jgi:hypothetical protein
MESLMPGRYPEAEDSHKPAIANPDSVVIDMQEFRKSRKIVDYDAKATRRPKPARRSGAGTENEPVE